MVNDTLKNGSTLQGGKYRIIEVLGQGGFGITYQAEQIMLKRKFAIKEFFMKNLCTRDEKSRVYTLTQADEVGRYRQKFIKEAQMMASLNHPGIVKVSDVFEENNTVYYVMEYIKGKSLSAIVKEKGILPEETALHYVLKVAEALDHIHQSHINHLDVKPANIMVRQEDGTPILIDFGISKQYDENENQTSTTPPGVSYGYSPLEQYRKGGVSTFTPQADIYALGATLYKLLIGETPPEASNVAMNGLPPLPDYISPNVRYAIEKAMQFRINDRPKSMREFIGMMKVEDRFIEPPEPPMDEETIVEDGEIIVVSEGEAVRQAMDNKRRLMAPSLCSSTKSQKAIIDNLMANMVRVEGGSFIMGATFEQGDDANDNEKPAHQVTVHSFSIGRYEVTQEEWETVLGENPSYFKGAKLPVENVSWEDCQKFIAKLNTITGKQFRLPTEAEWEFAARGGNKSRNYKYAGSNDIDEVAWYSKNSNDKGESNSDFGTHPVGQKTPNELELYDMSGNVWEWCNDKYAEYKSSSQTNQKSSGVSGVLYSLKGWLNLNEQSSTSSMGTSSKERSYRVYRGGGWNYGAWHCRVSNRNRYSPGYQGIYLGLRLAL